MSEQATPTRTTYDKISLLVDALRSTPPAELGPDGRDLAELVQIAQGFGIDPLSWLLPKTPAEADVLVDKLICLLFELRGDDLPPFDPSRYGEAEPEPA